MKKFWAVLLSLGLIAAFCTPAAAVDVSLKGTYIVSGQYEDNRALVDEGLTGGSNQTSGASMAFYAQRLRLEPVFKIADGLTFSMRMDVMQRVWGQTPVGSEALNSGWMNTRNKANEQNIHVDRGWVDFVTKIGAFKVGYYASNAWGTDFNDDTGEAAGIAWVGKVGPWLFVLGHNKYGEGRLGGTDYFFGGNVDPGTVDSDGDKYCFSLLYFGKLGQAGFLWCHLRDAGLRAVPFPSGEYKADWDTYRLYYKGAIGNLYSEAELQYDTGEMIDWEDNINDDYDLDDVDYEGWAWYLMLKYTMGPFFIGGQYAHVDGDGDGAEDGEINSLSGGNAWQPTLILWNDWIQRYAGNNGNALYAQTANAFANGDLYQIFAGYNPTPKWTIKGAFTMAYADETPEDFVDDEYGMEFDISASYKIFDNLQYMVGFGYLWAGDYYKGTDEDADLDDDYLIINQLTLSF